MLSALVPGGTFLLNSPFSKDEVWDHLPREVQEQLIAKRAKFYVIDAYQVARDTGMGSRMNTILQVCFFAISEGSCRRSGNRGDSQIDSLTPTARRAKRSSRRT